MWGPFEFEVSFKKPTVSKQLQKRALRQDTSKYVILIWIIFKMTHFGVCKFYLLTVHLRPLESLGSCGQHCGQELWGSLPELTESLLTFALTVFHQLWTWILFLRFTVLLTFCAFVAKLTTWRLFLESENDWSCRAWQGDGCWRHVNFHFNYRSRRHDMWSDLCFDRRDTWIWTLDRIRGMASIHVCLDYQIKRNCKTSIEIGKQK